MASRGTRINHTSILSKERNRLSLLFLDNNGLSWTVSAPDKVTAVPVRRNGNFQTPISVTAVRPKRCLTLSNPAHRQDYTVACLNYTLQTMMPLPGWPVMAPNVYDLTTSVYLKRLKEQKSTTLRLRLFRGSITRFEQKYFLAFIELKRTYIIMYLSSIKQHYNRQNDVVRTEMKGDTVWI